MTLTPVTFVWQDGAMHPAADTVALRQYEEGRRYRLVPYEPRSRESHNHYFAAVTEAWRNLPDHMLERIPTPEHLRKFALIRTGYRKEQHITFSTEQDAKQAATTLRGLDDYAIVVVTDCMVSIFTAESQSEAAMGKQRFQESKQAVLAKLADLLGVPVEDLRANAGRAA